jgi:hypothetical protein
LFFFSLVLNPRRSSKMWIEPLFLVRCFVSNPAIPAVAMASGSIESETRVVSCLFGFFVLKLLYACTYSTVAFLWFSW